MTRLRIPRAGAALLLAALAALPAPRAAAGDPPALEARVGYRLGAAPFSEEVGQTEFRGFVAELCDRAFALGGVKAEKVPVSPSERFARLDGGEVDMLCDTASVTAARAGKYLFSPMLFLAGVGYGYSAETEAAMIAAYEGAAPETRARAADASGRARAPFCAGEVPPAGDVALPADKIPLLRVGVLGGTTGVDAVRRPRVLKDLLRVQSGEAACIATADLSYEEGIDMLCGGEVAFFFGDRDMLRTAMEKRKAAKGCAARLSGRFLSYEPYALPIRADKAELALRVQTGVWRFFSDPEAVQALFAEHFPGEAPTPLVDALFRINRIAPKPE